jgi:hypothetical protein
MLTHHQIRDRRLDILRRLDRDGCALPLSKFESDSFEGQLLLALPQILSPRGRGWPLWFDFIAREHLCLR